MRLVVNKPGLFIGVKRGMIVVRERDKTLVEVAPPQISRVIVTTRGATLSTAFLRLLARHRIPLILLSGTGFPAAKMLPVRGGAIRLKRSQYEAQRDGRGLYLAKRFAWGKVVNQRAIVYHAGRDRLRRNRAAAKRLLEAAEIISEMAERIRLYEGCDLEEERMEIMRLEAEAAEAYWAVFQELLPEGVEFPGRKKRFDRPRDPANLLLNYGYGLLASEVLIALEYVGFEPYVGFLHKDSPRRPALAMDLMEEFRQPIVDRVVLRLLRNLEPSRILDGDRLSREARLELVRAFYKRLDETYTFKNRSLPLGDHILLQARRLALYLLDKAEGYTPFTMR